jgi:tol-pal system protein YbgF
MKANGKTFFFSPLLIIVFLLLGGCATQSGLDSVQRDTNNLSKEILALQRNIYELNAEMKDFSGKTETLDKRTGDLQREVSTLHGEVKSKVGLLSQEMETSSQPMRRYQADLGARLDKLQLDVQNLTGRFEESKYFAEKTFDATKNYQARIEELEKKVGALQQNLEGMQKRVEPQAGEGKLPGETAGEEGKPAAIAALPESSKEVAPASKAEETTPKPISGPDEFYKNAYEKYTKGDIAGAKRDFKKFLETYPKSKYAENAHFWLGECYFSEKKYEEAILEFDEVIKRYPKGNKVADALFRQGMAFLEMKDTTNAKLILKEVIRRYPQSDQANRARTKLKEIG